MGAAVIAEHAVLARSDAVAAAVSFSGFLAAYRFRNSRLILLSTVPMLLAFFYKQVFIGAAVGVFVYLVLQKRHKVALQFAGLLAVGMLGGLALRQFVFFRGQAFLLHFIGYNLLPYEARGWTMGWVHFSLLLGIPAIAAWQFLRRRGDKLLACYTVCVTLIPLLAIGKAGGTINDYVECSFLLVTLLACEITQTDRTNLSRAVWVLLLIIALLVNRPLATRNASPADLGRDHAIQVFLRENFPPGTPALGYYTGDLTRAGLDTPINSLWHYVYLTRLGKLAGVALMRDIQCRRLGAIVLDFDLKPGRDDDIANFTLTPEYRAAILANYSLLGTLAMPPLEMSRSNEGEVFIWVPRWDVQELTRSPAGGK